MATQYSGREYTVTLGTQDQSDQAIGTATVDLVANHAFRVVTPINDIAWDGGFQVSEIRRSGRRAMTAEDRVQVYGYGTWTWDFDYLVENEACAQVLLTAIGSGVATTTSLVFNEANFAATQKYHHGATGTVDVTCGIIINNPDDEDRVMHSAVLQNLTISMDADTDGGRTHMAGQFMTGYKPVIAADSTSPATTDVDWTNGLFELSTIQIGGHTVVAKAFSITLENPASRIGHSDSSGQTDGYVRGGDVNVSGSVTIKMDAIAKTFLGDWIANTSTLITMESGTSHSYVIHAAKLSGHNVDLADEGVFVEIPFVGTTGVDGASALCTIKMT